MISFICGQLCSGKTIYSQALASISNGVYIEIGDLVRKIKNSSNRKILQNSKELHEQISEYIAYVYNTNQPKQLIVSGVRQMEILSTFPSATLLWIECPKEERKKRYEDRAREGDSQTFEEAESGDIELGILSVKAYILTRNASNLK
jgi:cytidylate kinase